MERKKAIVIRTGCLSCRAHGIRCNPSNPDCKTYQSTTWTTNHQRKNSRQQELDDRNLAIISLGHEWEGTQRERQCLSFFTTISAPELAGYMDFSFWQELLLQATHHDDAIKHAVAAIGASHEYKLRVQASKYNLETEGLHLSALRQCNKAIKILLRPVGDPRERLLRALTASILFAAFESLNSKREAALPHVIASSKILKQLKQTDDESSKATFPVPLPSLEPLVAQYESQLGYYYGDDDSPLNKPTKLDLYDPVVIRSVPDARILLVQAISILQDTVTKYGEDRSEQGVLLLKEAKEPLADWLEKWGYAFDAFLFSTQMSEGDLRSCKLIRAHALCASICSQIDPTNADWEPFTDSMMTILALLTELHAVHPFRTTPSSQPPHTPYFSSTMGMTEPLYIIASRCTDLGTATKARALLGKLPPSEGASSSWRVSFLETFLVIVEGARREEGKGVAEGTT